MKFATFKFVAKLAVSACLVAAAPVGLAQTFPDKPVKIILGYAAGGPTDTLTRVLAEGLSRKWGQPVVVENRVGATATIATANVANAKPDGYTLLMAANDYAISSVTFKNLPYTVGESLTPIGLVAYTPNVLVLAPAFKGNSYADFVKAATDAPGRLSYSSTGSGSISHISAELFKSKTSLDVLHVPYKGFAASLPDLLGGRIDVAFPSLASVMTQIDSGVLRPVAIAAPERSPLVPEVPTFAELGVKDMNVTTWYGLLAPAKTPVAIIDQINKDVNQILSRPDIIEYYKKAGSQIKLTSPKEFDDQIKGEMKVLGTLASSLNLQD